MGLQGVGVAWATGRGPSTRAARVTAPSAARSARRLLLGVAAGSRGQRWSRRAASLLPDPAALGAVAPGPARVVQLRAQKASPPFHPRSRGSAGRSDPLAPLTSFQSQAGRAGEVKAPFQYATCQKI